MDLLVNARIGLELARQVESHLHPYCKMSQIAGSLRRQKPHVKDAEIVLVPKHLPTFLIHLDRMVHEGIWKKARYTDFKPRWGDKYRGIVIPNSDFPDFKIEIFMANPDNVGYILWLRTGPGLPENKFVMSQLSFFRHPVRFSEGYAWHGSYTGRDFRASRRVAVPDEATFFTLLGIEFIPPPERTQKRYEAAFRGRMTVNTRYIESLYIEEEKPAIQQGLF